MKSNKTSELQLLMNSELQTKNAIDKIQLNYNVSEMYYFFFHTLSHKINFERLVEYLSCTNKEVKDLISNICFQVSQILKKEPRTNKYTFYLSNVFYREPWRGQRLILELFKKQVSKKQELFEEIKFWENFKINKL